MGKVKRFKGPKLLSTKDRRVVEGQTAATNRKVIKKLEKLEKRKKTAAKQAQASSRLPSSTLFFNYNQSLGPPYQVICDTNFINFSIKNKLDVKQAFMDCLLAKTIPYVTECIIAELEKLGAKYRVALQIVKNNFEVLPCSHKGTYADDCIVDRIQRHKCYMVGTCDKELKGRIRKVPGIPIVYIKRRQYAVEKMPELE
jgi:U3 small nucleolar RNA-associated protein 24